MGAYSNNIDAAIGISGILKGIPVCEKYDFTVVRYFTLPSVAKANSAVVVHDTLQIMLSIKTGMEQND